MRVKTMKRGTSARSVERSRDRGTRASALSVGPRFRGFGLAMFVREM